MTENKITEILILIYKGYDVSLLIDMENLPPNKEELLKRCAMLKRHCFASVFEEYFRFQQIGEVGKKIAVIHYRDDETMYASDLYFLVFDFL